MEKVRIGNDMRVNFSVYRNGEPESFDGASNIVTKLVNEAYNKLITHTYITAGNIVQFDIDALQLTQCGKCRLFISYTKGGDYTVDSPAFELVNYTDQTGGTEIIGVEIVSINISGDIGINRDGLSAYEVWESYPGNEGKTIEQYFEWLRENPTKIDLDGLNSNIRQIKFNTDTPVAPTQAGQMAWSDEEKTGVLHNGYHSHPIGKETFFTAKNQSGTLIANGKAVYAIGSTGANATIGLATTANGDIAQRTIGIATMDIASNGFGDVTTFGEVNDINTSALTEGALVYLGLNGNLTSVEPVAPTPKISLGLCIRSHLTQGRIAVYVRPIARLNKLTDVYAPNLLDGDVLRWNGTALRYEVYNLVNKADLVAGKIPASQLPAYVDDIIEYANLAAFPAVGETGKLYVTLDTNLTYRWSGSAYTEVSKSLAIGITSTTAFRGDWGKTAYDHSQLTNSNPHGTTAAQIANTPAGTISATTVQAAINELDVDRVQLETDLNNSDTDFINALNSVANNIGYDLGLGKKTDDTYRLLNIIGKRTGYEGYLDNYTLHGFEYTPSQNDDIVTLIGNSVYNITKPIQSQMRPFEELISTKERFYLRDDVTKKIDGSASNLTDPNYLQKVYIPEFWYGSMYDSVRNKIQVWFSLVPVPGFMHIAPQAVCRYPGYIDGTGKARSHSGFKYPNNKNLVEFTTACQLTSIDLFVLPYYTYNALSLLLLHDIGRRNAQAVWAGLQTGSTYSNITSGKTDVLTTPSGEVPADAETASNKPFRWRFIENLYGDCWKILSGVYLNQVGAERRVMICPDPYKANTSSVISADYIKACIIAAGDGWLKGVNLPWINAKSYGASSTTGYCDYTYNNTTDKNILLAGGTSTNGTAAGPFSLYSNTSSLYRSITIGALFASIDPTKSATQIVKPVLIY